MPTVWSNCLAGWWLGGGGELLPLFVLNLGATLLYLGGMYLNDAFDADFDSQHRMERPIPSGAISAQAVWWLGLGWLTGGTLLLIVQGATAAVLAPLLAACIVLYDAVHKAVPFSPVLMALCRFLLYLIAASVAEGGVTGLAVWSAAALALYIVGLSYLARTESTPGVLRYWPCCLLAAPILLALIVNDGEFRIRGLILCLVLGLWVLHSLSHTVWNPKPHVGQTISGLLAGIIFVDWLAVADVPALLSCVFVLLFVLALFLQRFVPAT